LGEVDRDEQLLSLLVDIADIDTTFVCEEDPVTLQMPQIHVSTEMTRIRRASSPMPVVVTQMLGGSPEEAPSPL
jgi:hypothetical protein